MKKPFFVLPFDDYVGVENLLVAITKAFQESDINNLVSHVKLNDGVHNPDMGGPQIVKQVMGVLDTIGSKAKIFLDLKVTDVSATLVNILKKYNDEGYAPDILTVTSLCSVEGILKLRELLPNTKLALVSVPTDVEKEECQFRFGQAPGLKIYNDLMNIRELYMRKTGAYGFWPFELAEPFDLVVCSKDELEFLKKELPDSYGFIVPGIRDEWMKKPDEHQKRVTGVLEALRKGATFIVSGAQMVKGNPALGITPQESRKRTLAEVAKFTGGLIVKGDPLETLKNCDGLYESPKDKNGKYVGPVVGYAKKYDTGGGIMKNMVGFVYLNFAKAEQLPEVRNHFAELIAEKAIAMGIKANVVLGAPMGGLFLAADLGCVSNTRTIFAEKVVTVAANKAANTREESILVIDRHDLAIGEKVILVEDVTNNFSTTKDIKGLIEINGAKLVAIACAFNRSGKSEWEGIPVISTCDIHFDQYEQDDPEVADIIAAGKIVMKPKLEWSKLAEAMAEGKAENK
jgi:orotidine-5'-phosphate decarboxylase/adenine/guanine phosphoribosyltransferase-like PRPP-binding protein